MAARYRIAMAWGGRSRVLPLSGVRVRKSAGVVPDPGARPPRLAILMPGRSSILIEGPPVPDCHRVLTASFRLEYRVTAPIYSYDTTHYSYDTTQKVARRFLACGKSR